MPTQLEVYNLALLHLKETTLATISEAREARYILDDWWSQTRAEMLEAGFWKFALRTTKITQNTSITPAFGLARVHDKASDWVRTYQVSASEFMDPPLNDWIEESNAIFSDVTPIYVRYVSNNAEYGLNTDKWTARFTQAFSRRLALYAAPKLTGVSDASLEKMEEKADSELSKALSFEAMREPTRRMPDGRWNQARTGGRNGRADAWRYGGRG